MLEHTNVKFRSSAGDDDVSCDDDDVSCDDFGWRQECRERGRRWQHHRSLIAERVLALPQVTAPTAKIHERDKRHERHQRREDVLRVLALQACSGLQCLAPNADVSMTEASWNQCVTTAHSSCGPQTYCALPNALRTMDIFSCPCSRRYTSTRGERMTVRQDP